MPKPQTLRFVSSGSLSLLLISLTTNVSLSQNLREVRVIQPASAETPADFFAQGANNRGDVWGQVNERYLLAQSGEFREFGQEEMPDWQDGIGYRASPMHHDSAWPSLTDAGELVLFSSGEGLPRASWALGMEGPPRLLQTEQVSLPWVEDSLVLQARPPVLGLRGGAIGVLDYFQYPFETYHLSGYAARADVGGEIRNLVVQQDGVSKPESDMLFNFVQVVNERGDLMISGQHHPDGRFMPSVDAIGLVRDGRVEVIAHSGQPAPGLDGIILDWLPLEKYPRVFLETPRMELSPSGRAAVFDSYMTRDDGTPLDSGTQGLFEWREGDSRLLGRSGAPVDLPGLGTYFLNPSRYFSGRYVGEQVYFIANLKVTPDAPHYEGNGAVWRGPAEPENLVFVSGGPATEKGLTGPSPWRGVEWEDYTLRQFERIGFCEDLERIVMLQRGGWIWTVDLDPETDDLPVVRIMIGDLVEIEPGVLSEIEGARLIGVSDSGVVTAELSTRPSGRAVVQFDLRAGPADANINGEVTEGDIVAFILQFLAGDGGADLTGDGVLDNGDVIAFALAYHDATE